LHNGKSAHPASNSAFIVQCIVFDSIASCRSAHVHLQQQVLCISWRLQTASGAAHAGDQLWRQKEAARLGEEIVQLHASEQAAAALGGLATAEDVANASQRLKQLEV
jgi:hypothetical protein